MSAAAGNSTDHAVMGAALAIIAARLTGIALDPSDFLATYRRLPDGFALDMQDKNGRVWSCEFVAVGVGRGRKCTP